MAKIILTGTSGEKEIGRMTLQSEIILIRDDQKKLDTLTFRDHDEGQSLGNFLKELSSETSLCQIEPDEVTAAIGQEDGMATEITEVLPLYPNIVIKLITLNLYRMRRAIAYLDDEEHD